MRWPSRSNAAARFTESVDLPTPPLPLAIASTRVEAPTEIPFERPSTLPRSFCVEGRALLRAHHVELERDGLDSGQRQEVLAHLVLEARAKRAAGDGQGDRDGDVAALDANLAHHVELGDGPLQLGVDDLAERLGDLLARGLFHPSSVAAVRLRAASSARARS